MEDRFKSEFKFEEKLNRVFVWCLATGKQLSEAAETKGILE